ncbi:hypothetical protein [Fibrella aestuarina]|uniref:hypothetical protein n=1 Tax=Fibrella aestuarina TaxID=651143 RepID=UPI00059BD146|nr:hypothetical protein [Fibrella aestuarina]
MIGPQLILWSFLIVLPISAFVWSFLLVYPWRYFRQYLIGHLAMIISYYLLICFLRSPESDPDGDRTILRLVMAGYSHCLLGTLAAFFIRKKYASH